MNGTITQRESSENPQEIPGFPKFGYIALQGVLNTRDLGGMPTTDGRRIKRRRLIRSGDLADATAADITQLVCMHDLEYVVDLRTQAEIDRSPDPKPLMGGIEYEHLPVLSEASIIGFDRADFANTTKVAKDFIERPFETIQLLYPKALLGEFGMKAYSKLLHGLLNSPEGATLWHCTQGKDRTGIAAILIEYALSVPMKYIRDDYLATNLYIGGWIEKIKKLLKGKTSTRGISADIQAFGSARESYFDAALNAMNGTFGSIDTYLDKALDFGPDKRAALQEMYLEER